MSNKFNHGDMIRIVSLPTHLKTADPMPMLRPPNLLTIGDLGQIIDRKPGNYWVIKFDRGAFLLEDRYFEAVETSD
jgi:Protein of unknown function (DUF3148)